MLNYQQPDARGHFGPYGGSFVAETLVHALHELTTDLEIASDHAASGHALRSTLVETTARLEH